MTTERAYFTDGRDRDAEHDRLARLASHFDPATQDWLVRVAPLSEGDAALEFGFGAGRMLNWFAGRVGPTGRVLGIDTELGHARDLADGVVVRSGDVHDAPDEPGSFDLVYARLLLEHLPDPLAALRQMARWARPGAIVAIEDLDCRDVRAADPDHPDAPAFNAVIRGVQDALIEAGTVDPNLGARLSALMTEAGLTVVDETRVETEWETGSSWSRLQAETTRLLAAVTDRPDVMTDAAAVLERPGLRYHGQVNVAVAGRVAG